MTPLKPPVSAGNNSVDKNAPKKIQPTQPPWRQSWADAFAKFLYQEVTVEFLIGTETRKVTGKLTGWNWECSHCVVKTAEEILFVRHPLAITLRKAQS